MTIPELVKQYQEKTRQLEKAIDNLTISLREARGLEHKDDVKEYMEERLGCINKSQIYIQFIKDLEDLDQ